MDKHLATLPLLGTLAGTLSSALGVAWYVSSRVNPTPRRTFLSHYFFTPWELGVPYEAVTLRTADGLALRGWWLAQATPRGVLVGCHGHTGAKDDLLGIGTGLWRAGYAVLLFDMRGRGESDPHPNTLGGHELADVQAAIAFARQRVPSARLGVLGFSLGAGLALLAAAADPDVAAVVADSPFTSADAIVGDLLRKRVGQAAAPALLAATEAITARRYGYQLSQVRPIDAVARLAPRPLLLVHGTHDRLIGTHHAHALVAAARAPKELWLYNGADHCGAYFADRSGYVQRVAAFFQRALGGHDAL